MGLELNLVNLMDVLQKVTEVDSLGLHLGIPKHELDRMRLDYRMQEQRKMAMLEWWLNHNLNPTWERVITALRAMHEPVPVAEVSKRQSLYDSHEKDFQRWEEWKDNIKKIEGNLQLYSDLEREWKKGKMEWNNYLKKMEKVEEDWEDLIRTQQRETTTLGINSEALSMQRYSVLEYKVQQHVERSKELREFYERAAQHRRGLQNTEIELEAWEKELHEQTSELQNLEEQMEGTEFLGEAKDTFVLNLETSRERLQTCREKMSECRNELTKPQRQLHVCREKLTECEVNLKRCSDELGENHLQIKRCIEGMKAKSENQIQALTVAAGGLVGTAGGVGTAVAIGALGGPVGMVIGAGLGLVYGLIGGSAVAGRLENRLEETRKKLRRCEIELNNCSNVVKRCKEVLRRSQVELEELKRVVYGLEQCFYRDDLYISTTTMSLQKGW